jgi:antirestriction protein ArdC
MGVPIYLDGGDEAYYSPQKDEIHLPSLGSFESNYAFNATALHELSHSTGHPSRLNRIQSSFFGSSQYAYEELVAEMCSCFMGYGLEADASSEHLDNHKAYVQSWIQTIREKPETLIRAIRDAQGAASFMDWKAGLITEKEYETEKAKTFEVKVKDARDREGAR